MKNKLLALTLTLALGATLAATAARAQDNVFKFGVSAYTTHSQTDGITGIGVPAGADAKTGNATTVLFIYERLVTPHIGVELVLGIPPRIKAKATGTVAFLGDDVLSARNVTPALLVNYHFGDLGDTWRPYLGAGVNYTRFVGGRSRLASDVELGDSVGWAAQGGVDYRLDERTFLYASVSALRVKSKLVASGATVLQTTIDFRPVVYNIGWAWRF